MKISKQQFKAALNVAHEAGFNSGFECTDARWVEHNFGDNDDPHMAELIQDRDKAVKRIVKHEVKHAKMRKPWNVAADYVVNLDLEEDGPIAMPSILDDLLADYVVTLDLEKAQAVKARALTLTRIESLRYWEDCFLAGVVDDKHRVFIAQVLAREAKALAKENNND